MVKKHLISFLKFAFLWVVFHFSIGSFDHLNEPPKSVHQGAQCDRASLALNYYHNGMRLLYPEVHENRCKDGIVSCELPFSNYLTACLYKVFGFNELWFRLVTFSLFSIGMFALLLLFKLYVKPVVAYVLVFIIASSPIVLFYAANFIPDASALGLVLLAWYLFFRLFIPHPYIPNLKGEFYLMLFILALSLAIGSKSTCIIQWMSMAGVLVFSYFKKLKIELSNKRNLLLSLLLALIMPVLWQFWAHHLGTLHNSEFFMMHIPIPASYTEFKEACEVYFGNWPRETFRYPLPFIIGALLLLPLFFRKHLAQSLWYLSLFNTIGGLLFVVIMMKQFMYHDYYILCVLPCLFTNWIALASGVGKLRSNYWWLKVGSFVLLLAAFYFQYQAGKENLKSRYTEGNYWEQSQQNTTDYRKFKAIINRKGVNRNQCILVGYDGAPNNMLYLLDLYGRRINRDFSEEQIKKSVSDLNPVYVISNDTLFTQKIRPYFKELIPVAESKNLIIFKVKN